MRVTMKFFLFAIVASTLVNAQEKKVKPDLATALAASLGKGQEKVDSKFATLLADSLAKANEVEPEKPLCDVETLENCDEREIKTITRLMEGDPKLLQKSLEKIAKHEASGKEITPSTKRHMHIVNSIASMQDEF